MKNKLPKHGCINCNKCFDGQEVDFNKTVLQQDGWRITNNPMAWGGQEPEIIVLGFSKGPTQSSAIGGVFEDIPFKSHRSKIGKIFARIGLINHQKTNKDYSRLVGDLISNKGGRFHFGSLFKCSVEKYDAHKNTWISSGTGMLKFPSSKIGQEVAENCMSTYLGILPKKTKLIVMFGLGSKNKYVDECFSLFQKNRPGHWERINEVAYADGQVTVVHVDHFAVQGAHLPNWLGVNDHPRSELGRLAAEAVELTLSKRA